MISFKEFLNEGKRIATHICIKDCKFNYFATANKGDVAIIEFDSPQGVSILKNKVVIINTDDNAVNPVHTVVFASDNVVKEHFRELSPTEKSVQRQKQYSEVPY